MTNYSIEQIKALGQPPEVLNRRVAEHWSGPLYMRRISPYLSKVLLSLGFSPTLVTWLMVLSGWLAAASVIKTGLIGAILAVFSHSYKCFLIALMGKWLVFLKNLIQQEYLLIDSVTIQQRL